MNLWLLGTGESLLNYDVHKLKDRNTIALQKCFPYVFLKFGVVPTYWTWLDPYGGMEGLQYLNSLTNSGLEKFKDLKIVLPNYVCDSYETFRKYSGTTPLGRMQHGWDVYRYLLNELAGRGIEISIFDATSTKYLHYAPESIPSLEGEDWLGKAFESRFKIDKIVVGSCEFDSESVIGDKFKWGLESKLSSFMFPVAKAIGADKVFVLGFDCVGGRFYEIDGLTKIESGTRHPWNDETQKGNVNEIPLSMMKKWLEWQPAHKMNIYNVVEDKYTILNQVFEYKAFEEALGEG